MRRQPIVPFVTGCGLVLFVLWQSVFADEPGPKPTTASSPVSLHVVVDVHDSDKHLDGTLPIPGLTLKTETGSQTIEPRFLRRITFSPDEGHDAIETTDKTVIRGRLADATFTVKVGKDVHTLPRAEIREIRVITDKDTSLLAIGLGLLTLAAMEIVLGIDNIIFLAIVAARLPEERQPMARKIGLAAALVTRLALLFTLSFLLGLTAPIFTLPDLPLLHDLESREVSWRDIILFGGGTFLIGKSVMEMHEKLEEARHAATHGVERKPGKTSSFARVIFTIAVVDIIFSLDSVITAVGMVDELWVMVTAMIIAMLVMMMFAEPISRFVNKHPTIKVLALSFLILIGVLLVAESLGQHIDKGYIYFAMAFAVGIEMINMRLRRPAKSPGHEHE